MTTAPPDLATPELLLEQAGWIRRLARQLVGDAQRADDLAQETWVRMLCNPPATDRPIRGWIATVMRNLLCRERYADERRRERERRAARHDRDDSVELLDKISSQREVTAAVLALDEPYRTTILLRYFEGCTPRRIATRQGIPVSTVKTRLARGLERLRTRLQERHGNDRHGWLAALLPLARRPEGLPALSWPLVSAGVLAVNTKLVLGAVAVSILGASLFVFNNLGAGAPPDGSSGPDQSVTGVVASSSPATATPAVERSVARTEVNVPAAPSSPAATPVAAVTTRGIVLDVRGHPIANVDVIFDPRAVDDGREAAAPRATSGSDGRFTISARPTARNLVIDDARFTSVLTASQVADTTGVETVLVVAPAIALRGRIVDQQGAPIAEAHAELHPPRDLRARVSAVLDYSADVRWHVESDAEGRFAFDAAPAIAGAELQVSGRGYQPWSAAAPETSRTDLVVVLEPPPPSKRVLEGVVVDQRGTPVEGALVSMGLDTTTSDAVGKFAFELDAEKTFNRMAARFVKVDESRLLAVKQGYLPGEQAAELDPEGRPVWPEQVVLRLGGEPLALAGIVVDDEGEPQPGMRVWVADPTFFGGLGDPETGRFPRIAHVESVLSGSEPGWLSVETDAAGRFELGGLMQRTYAVQAMNPANLLRTEVTDVAAGRGDVRIVLSSANTWPSLKGRVVDSRGEPIEGVSVFPMCDAFVTRIQGTIAGTSHSSVDGTSTDADGRFELSDVPRNLVYLRLQGANTVPLEWGRHIEGGLAQLVGQEHEALVITLGRRCHFQVELARPDEADQLGVLDAAGEPLEISEFMGSGRREGHRLPLTEGHSNPLAVGDTASTLVLYKDGDEVRRVPLRLTPGEQTVVRQ